jgi:hypothetical protein
MAPRVVYVPPPPAVTEQIPAISNGELVIQAPAPPKPVQEEVVSEEPIPGPKPAQPQRRVTPAPRPSTDPETTVPPISLPEVPALEPRESPARQSELRQQVVKLLAGIQGDMSRIKERSLSDAERKTLEDAQTFLEQSQKALETNDLVRARNLAEKSVLLVSALAQ